ncbi:MAG: hypothetical protein ACI4K5_08390 [Ruminococcus sp.]
MTAKEYLSQAYKLDKQAGMIIQKADAMRKSLYGRGQSYENTGHSSNNDGIAKAIEKVADYERKADEIIDKLVDMRIEIENTISLVPDPIQREVLEKRYLLYKKWDGYYDKEGSQYIKGIYEEMGCSRSQMFRYHKDGLKFIENLILNDTIKI